MAALITAEALLSAWPGLADLSEDEQARVILVASAAVEAYVGRDLLLAAHVEKHRPGPARMVYLYHYPVASVAYVKTGRAGSQVTLAADQYEVDAETGKVELFANYGVGFRYPDRQYGGDPRSGDVEVSYQGGYDIDDLPADITQAVILAAMSASTTQSSSGGGLYASEQIGSYSYRLGIGDGSSASITWANLSPPALANLRRYRRSPRFA